MKKLALLTALALFPLVASHAQERTAGSSIEVQTTWTALKLLAEQADAKAQAAAFLASSIDSAIRACGLKGMVYSPGGSGADAAGCINAGNDLLTGSTSSGGSRNVTFPRSSGMVVGMSCSASQTSNGGSSSSPSGSASVSIRLGTPSGWVTVAKDSDTCGGSNGDSCTASASAGINIYEKNGTLYKYTSAGITPNGISVIGSSKLMATNQWDGRAELKGKSCSTSISTK